MQKLQQLQKFEEVVGQNDAVAQAAAARANRASRERMGGTPNVPPMLCAALKPPAADAVVAFVSAGGDVNAPLADVRRIVGERGPPPARRASRRSTHV